MNCCNHSGRSRNGFARTVSFSPFLFVFSVAAGSCDGLTRTVLLVLSHLDDAGCNVKITASCNTDVGDAGVAELEELVDKPRTPIGTLFSVLHFIFDELWFLTTGPLVGNIRDLRRVFRVREPVYLREALLSRINSIL